jgi:hypothetical protein
VSAPQDKPFSVTIPPDMPLARRVKHLHDVVADQLEEEEELLTDEVRELIAISLKIELLSEDPFRNTIRIPRAIGGNLFLSFTAGVTFFHKVEGTEVYLLGAIYSGGPESPEAMLQERLGITALADRVSRYNQANFSPEDPAGWDPWVSLLKHLGTRYVPTIPATCPTPKMALDVALIDERTYCPAMLDAADTRIIKLGAPLTEVVLPQRAKSDSATTIDQDCANALPI